MRGKRYFITPGFFLFAVQAVAVLPALAQSQAIIVTVAGNGMRGAGGDNGPATQAQLHFLEADPTFLTEEEYSHPAFDSAGNLYIADQANDRVRKITPEGVITTVAGKGPDTDPSLFGGDGGLAVQALLRSPKAVAVDKNGNLLIVDQDNDRVRRVDANGIITTIAGDGNPDSTAGDGNGGQATQAGLNAPGGIALDAAGDIYLSDTFNDQIRKIAPDGKITAFAGGAEEGYGGDGGSAFLALLDSPAGLAVDAGGSEIGRASCRERV